MNFKQFLKTHLERKPYFLVLIPLFLLIHIEQEFQYMIPYRFVYKEIIELLIPPLIIYIFNYFLFRDKLKSSMNTAVLLIAFYFFCDLKDWLHTHQPGLFISKYTFLLPLLAVVLLSTYWWVKKYKGSFANGFLFLNGIFFLFIVSDIIPILIRSSPEKNDLGDHSKAVSGNYISCSDCIKPDIYYIIADAYSSSGVLKHTFNYDNQPLDSFLIQNHFYIINNSKSNYNLTPFSIASTFNMDYLPMLDYHRDVYIKEYLAAESSVYSSEIFPILAKEGYQILNYSPFNIKEYPTQIEQFDMCDTYLLYTRHNIFKKINRDIGWLIRQTLGLKHSYLIDPEYIEKKDIHFLKTATALISISQNQSLKPRFIYGHLLLPHLPSGLDSARNKSKISGNIINKEGYLEMVRLVRNKLIRIVQSIMKNSRRPVVIIIQGDHGYRSPEMKNKQLEFPNLNAMYFYNQDYRLLNDSLSNVNSFRVLFNSYFKKNYPLLQDKSYFLQYK